MPSCVIVTAVGNAVCPKKATVKRSVITCVSAVHRQAFGVTRVIVATIGMNTVVPCNTGVSYLYATVAVGWSVDVAHTHRHSFSLKVAKTLRLLATAAVAKPTGDKYTAIVVPSFHLAATAAVTPAIASATVRIIPVAVEPAVAAPRVAGYERRYRARPYGIDDVLRLLL